MKSVMGQFGSHGVSRSDFGMLVPQDKTKVIYYAIGTAALIMAYLYIANRNYGK